MPKSNRDAVQKILSLDIGGSKILSAVAVTSANGGRCKAELFGVSKRPLNRDSGKIGVWHAILSSIGETLAKTGFSWDEIDSIGATIPGVADPKRGYWIYAPFSGISDFPLASDLRAQYGKPVFADNDVNACAWGEKMFGVCQGVDNFLWITISNGIGGGLVLNGRVYPGKFSGAAEIGHLNVVENGAPCGCGNRGCLEAMAAGPAIARRYRERVECIARGDCGLAATELEAWSGYLRKKYGNVIVESRLFDKEAEAASLATAEAIAKEARNGNPVAMTIFQETGMYVGRAASWAANVINPEKIVVGGGVAGAFDLLYPSLWKHFQDCLFKATNKTLTIEKTGLGYEAGLVGAASLAFENPYEGM